MVDSVNIPVPQGTWADVTDGAKKGYITNHSGHALRQRTAVGKPDNADLWGHTLNPSDPYEFDLKDSERIWARAFEFDDGVISLTRDCRATTFTSSKVSHELGTQTVDASGRLRVSISFGLLEDKFGMSDHRPQWSAKITGLIISYDTLVGGPFQVGEEIRGPTGVPVLAIGEITSDNGTNLMVIDCDTNYFEVGDTITGQISGATANITGFDGADAIWNYNQASVDLTCGKNDGDSVVRQSFRRATYIQGRANLFGSKFKMAPAQTNQIQRVGTFDDTDGLFLERTFDDVALVRRTSVSGTPFDDRIPQNTWTMDRLDGGISGGPNPSGLTLDLDKIQALIINYTWSGDSIYFSFFIDGKQVYIHRISNTNVSEESFMRLTSLPMRFEIRNIGPVANSAILRQFSSAISSEGGADTPGYGFSASNEAAPRTIPSQSGLVPILAVRLKNTFKGFPNRRTVKITNAGLLSDKDIHAQLRLIHEPVDITATWQDAGFDSAVEYSLDISDVTARPVIEVGNAYLGAGPNVRSASNVPGDFLNYHSFITQNPDSNNSEMFVFYADPLDQQALEIYMSMGWVEFE